MNKSIEIILNKNFRGDSMLKKQMAEIALESFSDIKFMHEKHFKVNDTAYLVYEGSKLCAYMLSNWNEPVVAGIKPVYMGFAATLRKYRNQNIFKLLLEKFNKEANDWVSKNRNNLIGYGFTSNPSTYRAYNSVFKNVQPYNNKNYDTEVLIFAQNLIQKKYNIDILRNGFPFLLHNFVQQRYNQREYNDQLMNIKTGTIFENLKVNERNGDRVMIMSVYTNRNNC